MACQDRIFENNQSEIVLGLSAGLSEPYWYHFRPIDEIFTLIVFVDPKARVIYPQVSMPKYCGDPIVGQ